MGKAPSHAAQQEPMAMVDRNQDAEMEVTRLPSG